MSEKIVEFVEKLNKNEELLNVKVPIIDGFRLVPNDNTLFTAVNDEGFIEQFLFDGVLNDGETFDEHIEKVINETKDSMRKASLSDVDNSFLFCKEYKGKYDFKIYIQDSILGKKMIRTFNIYFMNNDTRAFYEITFSSCPYSINDLEFIDNELVSNMMNTVFEILKNVE